MAKISNTGVYANIDPILTDYFVLTDIDNNLATKSCTLGSVKTLFGLGITNITVPVSAAYLSVLGTQDFVLIAAPGANYVLDIQNIVFFMQPGSVAYNFGAAGATLKQGAYTYTQGVPQATLNSTTNVIFKSQGSQTSAIDANSGLVLGYDSTNPTAGNGILYANITYQTLKLDSTF